MSVNVTRLPDGFYVVVGSPWVPDGAVMTFSEIMKAYILFKASKWLYRMAERLDRAGDFFRGHLEHGYLDQGQNDPAYIN